MFFYIRKNVYAKYSRYAFLFSVYGLRYILDVNITHSLNYKHDLSITLLLLYFFFYKM
jgi:hypothetical protein